MEHILTWHGHSNFILETRGRIILFDPFYDGNPTCTVRASSVTRADVICLTHDHGDHLGQTLDIAARTGAKVVGVFDTVGDLAAQGLPQGQAVGMNIGGTVREAGVRIKMVQAMHSSKTGVAAGYILTLEDGFCLYHSGDTGLFASMELFGRLHPIDLALLPIDGRFNMDHEAAALACSLLKCTAVTPIHWGTFPVLAQETASFAASLAALAPETRLAPMTPGTPVALSHICVRCRE